MIALHAATEATQVLFIGWSPTCSRRLLAALLLPTQYGPALAACCPILSSLRLTRFDRTASAFPCVPLPVSACLSCPCERLCQQNLTHTLTSCAQGRIPRQPCSLAPDQSLMPLTHRPALRPKPQPQGMPCSSLTSARQAPEPMLPCALFVFGCCVTRRS